MKRILVYFLIFLALEVIVEIQPGLKPGVIITTKDTILRCPNGERLELEPDSELTIVSELLPNKTMVKVPNSGPSTPLCEFAFVEEKAALSLSAISSIESKADPELNWKVTNDDEQSLPLLGDSPQGLDFEHSGVSGETLGLGEVKPRPDSEAENSGEKIIENTNDKTEDIDSDVVITLSPKKKVSKLKLERARNKRAGLTEKKILARNKNKNNLRKVPPKLAVAVDKVATKMKYAERCKEEFINSEGLGPWGRYINNELSRKYYSSLLHNTKAFRGFCPGYRFMSTQERKSLLVFIVMSMSHYESSCRPKIEAQGPYGTARGLLQLHAGSENRYFHWDLDRICRRGDSKKPIESIQCTLSMLNGQVERYNSIFYEGSYWDVLRNANERDTHANKIKKAIRMVPGCEMRSVAGEKNANRTNG